MDNLNLRDRILGIRSNYTENEWRDHSKRHFEYLTIHCEYPVTIEKDISVFKGNCNQIEGESNVGLNKIPEKSQDNMNTKFSKTTLFNTKKDELFNDRSKFSPNQSKIKKHEISNNRSYKSNMDFHKRNEMDQSRSRSNDMSIEQVLNKSLKNEEKRVL